MVVPSGLVVTVIAMDPRLAVSNAAEGDGFSRAINIGCTPSSEEM
jgi:hypothetical protein